mmetsp:Transcript_18296/g.37751  ORF Transcript_18296/g.37751 Transcript_18296/m.37751 type:complete len:211 (-) Transcript_18296:94-726(-)
MATTTQTTAMAWSVPRSGTIIPTGTPRPGTTLLSSPTSHRAAVNIIVRSHRTSRPRAPAASPSSTTPRLVRRAKALGRRRLPSRRSRRSAWAALTAVTIISAMCAVASPITTSGASPPSSQAALCFACATTSPPWTWIPGPRSTSRMGAPLRWRGRSRMGSLLTRPLMTGIPRRDAAPSSRGGRPSSPTIPGRIGSASAARRRAECCNSR